MLPDSVIDNSAVRVARAVQSAVGFFKADKSQNIQFVGIGFALSHFMQVKQKVFDRDAVLFDGFKHLGVHTGRKLTRKS